MIKIESLNDINNQDIDEILGTWKLSVRATHNFLSVDDIKELINHCFTTEEGVYIDFNLLIYLNHKFGAKFSGGFLTLYSYTNGDLSKWEYHIDEYLSQSDASKRSLKKIINFLVYNEIVNETRNNKF